MTRTRDHRPLVANPNAEIGCYTPRPLNISRTAVTLSKSCTKTHARGSHDTKPKPEPLKRPRGVCGVCIVICTSNSNDRQRPRLLWERHTSNVHSRHGATANCSHTSARAVLAG